MSTFDTRPRGSCAHPTLVHRPALQTTLSRINAVLLMLVGNIMFAIVFGVVVLGMQRMTASRDVFSERMNNINETMNWKGVPEQFQRRVRRFYEFLWLVDGAAANEDRGQGSQPMQWLDELPTGLRVEINTARYSPILRSCVLFSEAEWEAIVMIAQQLTPMLYMPNEVIVKEGLVGYSMYFIERGQVKVIVGYASDSEREVGTLSAGSFFGEVALTKNAGTQRAATCISSTVLMLDKLTRSSLEHVAASFPNLLASIRRIAMARRRELGEEIRALGDQAGSALIMMKFANRLKALRAKRAQGLGPGGGGGGAGAPKKLGLKAAFGGGGGGGGGVGAPGKALGGGVHGLGRPGLARQQTLGNNRIVTSLLKAKGDERSPPQSARGMRGKQPKGAKVAPTRCVDDEIDHGCRPGWSSHGARPGYMRRNDTLSLQEMQARHAMMKQSSVEMEQQQQQGEGGGGGGASYGGLDAARLRATLEQMLDAQTMLARHVAKLEEKIRPHRGREHGESRRRDKPGERSEEEEI